MNKRKYAFEKEYHREYYGKKAIQYDGLNVFLEDQGAATKVLLNMGIARNKLVPVSKDSLVKHIRGVKIARNTIGRILADDIAPNTVWFDYCGDLVGCYEREGLRVLKPERWVSPLDDIAAFAKKFASSPLYAKVNEIYILCTTHGRPRRRANNARINRHKRVHGISAKEHAPSIIIKQFMEQIAIINNIKCIEDSHITGMYKSQGKTPMYNAGYYLSKV